MIAETIGKFKKAVEERPEQLVKAREKGAKVVGYFCSYIPEEIIQALELIPIRLGRGGDDHLVEIGGRYISTINCVFVRQSMGEFAEGKDPFFKNCDIAAEAATCIQMYRMAELIRYFFKKPVVILGVPRNFFLPEGRVYFRKEVEDFARQLENIAGRKLDSAALRESIELYGNIRQTLLEIYEFQAMNPAPMGWRDVFNIIHAGFFLDRPHYLSLLKELLSDLIAIKESDQLPGLSRRDERPRILLSGTIIPPGDTKLIDTIEQSGGRIVADDLCTGLRFFTDLVVKDNSLNGIADAYLDKVPCASLPYPVSVETDRRLANLARLVDTYQVEGMIYHSLRFCDSFSFKAKETKDFLKNKIPFIEIHTEYASSDIESIRTRVEAFLELLDSVKPAVESK